MTQLDIRGSVDDPIVTKETQKLIAQARRLDLKMKRDKIKMEEFKEALRTAMTEHGIKKFENDLITATVVPAHTQTKIDSKKLKEEKPKIYAAYASETNVKESLRVTFKE